MHRVNHAMRTIVRDFMRLFFNDQPNAAAERNEGGDDATIVLDSKIHVLDGFALLSDEVGSGEDGSLVQGLEARKTFGSRNIERREKERRKRDLHR